ncbi:MAG: sensor histidine kinase [Pseudomonadota bacterium]
MRFAIPSSTSSRALVAGFALAIGGSLIALLVGSPSAALVGVGFAGLAGVLIVFHLLQTERERHELAEDELHEQAQFLESLVASVGEIAAETDPEAILEHLRREAEELFDARAELLPAGSHAASAPAERAVIVPLRVGGEEIAALRLARGVELGRVDVARAALLADLAARVYENARLRAEAQVREGERSRLSDQLITAEQDERRRLALYLHDTSVQSLAGIGLMLDASLHSIETGDLAQAREVIGSALERHRATIGALRDLSFNLEPVVLRDQGLEPAVRALAEQIGLDRGVQVEVELGGIDVLPERAQAALYQIVRESMNAATRREPTRIDVSVAVDEDGSLSAVVHDDGREERRRSIFDALAERARTLNGRLEVDQGEGGGTTVRLTLPPYAVGR